MVHVMVNLTIKDRIVLLQILKGFTGDVIFARIIKDSMTAIGFEAEELAKIGMEFDADSGETHWNESSDSTRDFEFEEIVFNKIQQVFVKKNDANTITIDDLDLYEKFVDVAKVEEE